MPVETLIAKPAPPRSEESPAEIRRLNKAISEAMEDVRTGRTHTAKEFLAKVQQQWPRQHSV